MYGLDWFLQLSMATISFAIACKELKLAQIAQINKPFQLLNSICACGDLFYGFTCMLISKNVSNDVSKDLPLCTHKTTVNFLS